MTTYTNFNGTTFNLDDFGPNSQHNRYVAWYDRFDGRLGKTFKLVLIASTECELKEKMENHNS